VDLDNVSVSSEDTSLAEGHVLLSGVLSETPVEGLGDLLAASKLELSTADGLDNMLLVGILGADRQEDLTNVDTGGDANGLAVRVTHTGGETISSGA